MEPSGCVRFTYLLAFHSDMNVVSPITEGRVKLLSKRVRFSCSKMSCDAFPNEALYEADKALENFAAAPREFACLQDGGRSRR